MIQVQRLPITVVFAIKNKQVVAIYNKKGSQHTRYFDTATLNKEVKDWFRGMVNHYIIENVKFHITMDNPEENGASRLMVGEVMKAIESSDDQINT